MQLHFSIITTEAAVCPPTSFLPVFKIGLQFLLRHQFTPIGNIFVSVPLHQGEAVSISVSAVCDFQEGYLKESSYRGRLPFCPKVQEWWPVVPQPLWTVRWPRGWRWCAEGDDCGRVIPESGTTIPDWTGANHSRISFACETNTLLAHLNFCYYFLCS